jgi:ethanolamine utilization protein EutA
MERLWTKETNNRVIADRCAHRSSNSRRLPRHFAPRNDSKMVISFSGGVADCIGKDLPERAFGDMGPALGRAIFKSRLCQGEYVLGRHTIRATVIGAGCYSAQLSGSTVYHRNIRFPLKNLPVIVTEDIRPDELRRQFSAQDTPAVLALPGIPGAQYHQISALADVLAQHLPSGPVYITTRCDMAKALGQALALRLKPDRPVLCLDGLLLEEGCFLDVGHPVGPALPVVIKTLILANR